MKKNIIIYLLISAFLFIIAILTPVENDGIWGYGFSYNIASSLIPYKDFNMIVGPLYNLIFSIPMKLFGNYFYLFEIMHCILYAFIFTYMYKKIRKNIIFIIMVMALSNTFFGYNAFCTILFLLLLLLKNSDYKYKEILIGIIIGSILMTKHNIGLVLLFVYIYDNRKKLINTLSILIPIIPIFLYLLINNTLYEYINFCYLGMGGFLKNLNTDYVFIPMYIYLIYKLFKYKNKNTILFIYILFFQIMCFPIFNAPHIMCSVSPILYYIFLYSDNKKTIFFIKYFITIGFTVMIIINPINNSSFIFKNNFLNNKRLYNDMKEVFDIENNYYNKVKNDYDNIYLFVNFAYSIKLYNNENPSFYDMINKGNLGKNEDKYISKIDKECKNKKCLFILENLWFKDNDEIYQINNKFKKYVINNYKYKETLDCSDRIYTN